MRLSHRITKQFRVEEYEEYEPVLKVRIRDLNKKSDYLVETVKKEWSMRRASHYRIRDQNPQIKYSSPPRK